MKVRTCLLIGFAWLQIALSGSPGTWEAVMGNWEGSFIANTGESGALTAKVIALGGGNYLAVVDVLSVGLKAQISGRTEAGEVMFEGEVDLGEAYGGSVAVGISLSGNDLQGRFVGKTISGTLLLHKVNIRPPALGISPPEGAVVLFDGSDLSQWMARDGGPAGWKILADGTLVVGDSDIVSSWEFGDARIHLEFRTPFMPGARGQDRGNSGVYVQGRYEIQVLDSFGLEPRDDGCGGIYKVAAPLVNACLPPLSWQTYDIEFQAPRFDATGRKVYNARVTVRLNGILIHDQVELQGPTPGGLGSDEVPKAGLLLQDHGNPVQYRNIWIKSL